MVGLTAALGYRRKTTVVGKNVSGELFAVGE